MKKNKLVNKANYSILETLPEDPLFENKSTLEIDLNQFDLFNRIANETVEELIIKEVNDPNDRSDKSNGVNLNAKVYVEKEKKTSLKKDFVITFVDNLEALAKLNLKPNEFRIIVEIVKVMEYGNLINLSQSTIAKNLNLAKSNVSYYFKNRKKAEKYIKLFKKKNLDKHDKILSESINLIKQPQASFVLMEQSTGKVRAIVGGRGEKTANRTLNRASSSKRQPGSTFKVLSTYLPALDTSGFTLANVMDDAPYKYPGTNKRVKDWDSSGYKGLTSLRQGIVDSVNIVTVKTFQKVTPQTGFDYLLNLGFTTLVDRRETSDGQIYSDI